MSKPPPTERELTPVRPGLARSAPRERLGGLELVERLGHGGMGEVWRARDPQLDREVAVKLMRSERGGDEAEERFRREARSAAAVRHRNVAQVLFAGVDQGRLYYAMELVEGRSLSQMLRAAQDRRARHLPVARCVDFLRQAAEGLRAAHEAGVLHRDIKPSNLMVDQVGCLKIVDFGLARREDDASLTRTGVVLGTASYMAPEQARGLELDHRTDIYALGATFYHLLVGEPPFVGSSALSVLSQHVETPLPPLAERDPSLPPEVCRIVERMLAKAPADRYQSYDALLVDLAGLGGGSARPEGRPRASRRGWLAVLAAAALVVLLVAAAWLMRGQFAGAPAATAKPALASPAETAGPAAGGLGPSRSPLAAGAALLAAIAGTAAAGPQPAPSSALSGAAGLTGSEAVHAAEALPAPGAGDGRGLVVSLRDGTGPGGGSSRRSLGPPRQVASTPPG